MKNPIILIVSLVLCQLTGLLATPVTLAAIPQWYVFLVKPPFSPPTWVFGPVWTLLYVMMGISLYLIWRLGWKRKRVRNALSWFFAQLFANFFWSISFFGLRSPILGLINIVVLWMLIVLSLKKFFPLSRVASYLLVPYLLWVSFALVLNLSIVVLN